MGGRTIDVRAGLAGLVVVALLGLAGCGDDDDGSGLLGAGDSGDAAAQLGDQNSDPGVGAEAPPGAPAPPGEALGVCDLLEKAEVEAQFGDLGAVADGETSTLGCQWKVGDPSEGIADIPPALTLQVLYHPDPELDIFYPSGPPEEQMDDVRSRPGVVAVPGLADEALMDFGVLYVRSGEVIIAVGAYTIPDSGVGTDALRTKLVTLAGQVVSRM